VSHQNPLSRIVTSDQNPRPLWPQKPAPNLIVIYLVDFIHIIFLASDGG
jgi:hypothetical protein